MRGDVQDNLLAFLAWLYSQNSSVTRHCDPEQPLDEVDVYKASDERFQYIILQLKTLFLYICVSLCWLSVSTSEINMLSCNFILVFKVPHISNRC
jgi:hypothetical protein